MRHTQGDMCDLCSYKLKEVHPVLVEWFLEIKKDFEDVHISWGFRDEESQNIFFHHGKTRVKFPNSKHNHMVDGKPCSLAIDLFKLRSDLLAEFSEEYYRLIYIKLMDWCAPINWGGNWKKFKDAPHFELDLSKLIKVQDDMGGKEIEI